MKHVGIQIKKPLRLPGIPSNEASIFYTFDNDGSSCLNLKLKFNTDESWCKNFNNLKTVVIRE